MAIIHSIVRFIMKALFLPVILMMLWCFGIITFNTFKFGLVGFVIFFGILPFFFKYSVTIQKSIIFLNFIQYPAYADFDSPEKYGIDGARNKYIKFYSNVANRRVRIGFWHILPEKYKNWTATDTKVSPDLDKDSRKDAIFDELLIKGDCPIILYAHGNSNNRASGHRLELYKVLQDAQFHVITFDYRGYGDSSRASVSELGLVEDEINVYKWILEKLQDSKQKEPIPLYIWGHSLGTGATTHTLALLASEISSGTSDNVNILREPNGVFLESPFNNLFDEFEEHFLAKVYNWLPWYRWMILNAIDDSNITFRSDDYINAFTSPVLILHAKEDLVVPYDLGVRLYESAITNRPSEYGKVEFKGFEASDNLGHKYICRSHELNDLISSFIKKYNQNVPKKIIKGRINIPWLDDEVKKIFHEKQT